MKRILCFLLSCMLLLVLSACSSGGDGVSGELTVLAATDPPISVTSESQKADDNMAAIQITAGDKIFLGKLYNNQTTQAFIKQLPLTITMDELHGNEKFYYLPEALPTDSYRPGGIKAGELMLFGSDCLVLFYEDFSNSYSYTKLGFIEDVTGLSGVLGSGSIQVSFRSK